MLKSKKERAVKILTNVIFMEASKEVEQKSTELIEEYLREDYVDKEKFVAIDFSVKIKVAGLHEIIGAVNTIP